MGSPASLRQAPKRTGAYLSRPAGPEDPDFGGRIGSRQCETSGFTGEASAVPLAASSDKGPAARSWVAGPV